MRFGQKEKLSPRFIGPYEILERVGPVAYKLALPPELDKIHNVFHVSMLRRYHSDRSHVLPVESIEVNPDLTYNEEPILIQAREVKQLRNKRVPIVEESAKVKGAKPKPKAKAAPNLEHTSSSPPPPPQPVVWSMARGMVREAKAVAP
ncbi:uncharacterized protein LOC125868603 [Solanum stenotomum]|uniref:uncharacterized protein LOC125868603 n=1 Tax=Solanum stenotomum TaxID=172797 RepID=UPI0020D01CEB|nr:uncharacterized protein LOC125868603 [Solanum stenotomum]